MIDPSELDIRQVRSMLKYIMSQTGAARVFFEVEDTTEADLVVGVDFGDGTGAMTGIFGQTVRLSKPSLDFLCIKLKGLRDEI